MLRSWINPGDYDGRALEESIREHLAFSRNKDAIERSSIDLAMRLQHTRLAWLEDFANETVTSP